MCRGLCFAHVSDAFDQMVLGPLVDTNHLQHWNPKAFAIPQLEELSTADVGSFSGISTETANRDVEPELYQAFAVPNTSSIDAWGNDVSVSASSSRDLAVARHLPADGYNTALSHESCDLSGTYDATAKEDEIVELVTRPTRPPVESIAPKKPRQYPLFLGLILRTRIDKKPRLEGPNRYGRTGCKKCTQCRKHRQKVYINSMCF